MGVKVVRCAVVYQGIVVFVVFDNTGDGDVVSEGGDGGVFLFLAVDPPELFLGEFVSHAG